MNLRHIEYKENHKNDIKPVKITNPCSEIPLQREGLSHLRIEPITINAHERGAWQEYDFGEIPIMSPELRSMILPSMIAMNFNNDIDNNGANDELETDRPET